MGRNSYVLGKRIARGGMAEIYLGKAVGEAAFQRICAIKRILPHYAQDEEFVTMFRDEAHICKRLQHANIVQVYDFTEVEGSYALIMEHVDGADLRTLLSACEVARTRISTAMSLYIAANSARALHYAHTKADEITKEPLGIVHRDISPQNILISFEGEVKITDFGIASAENKITETRPGVVKGKYSYMSPEQVTAKSLDGRSDIFSLAIVLWECLAMKRLFSGQSEVESISKVQQCQIGYDLRELNPEVDDKLYQIVMKGLAKDRRHRYQTAAAFEKDLLRYLHTRYSDFTSSELGNFLKRILAKKRNKTQDDIKETLSALADIQSKKSSNEDELAKLEKKVSGDESIIHQKDASSVREYHGSDRSISLKGGAVIKSSPPITRQTALGHTQVGNTRHNNASYHRPAVYQKPRDHSNWLMITIGLFLIVATVFFVRFQLLDDKMHIEFETEPKSVSIKVNGQKIRDSYTFTPNKISIMPGNYKLEFSRPGYETGVFTVSGKKGDTVYLPKIFLQKDKSYPLTRVRIHSPQKKVFVSINDGLYRGPTPMIVELEANSTHKVQILSSENNSMLLPCKFKVTPSKSRQIPILAIRESSDNKRVICSLVRP